jgi:hypothetical protein
LCETNAFIVGDLIILEAFPGYTFETLGDLSQEDWLFLYAKARTTLEHIRRDPVLNEKGLPLISPTGQSVTIDKYPHIREYGLFGEDPPVIEEPQPQAPPPAYKVDPETGNPIPVGGGQSAMEDDDDMFSGVSFNPGMSSKPPR